MAKFLTEVVEATRPIGKVNYFDIPGYSVNESQNPEGKPVYNISFTVRAGNLRKGEGEGSVDQLSVVDTHNAQITGDEAVKLVGRFVAKDGENCHAAIIAALEEYAEETGHISYVRPVPAKAK